MSAPDISAEAVERLARVHEGLGWPADVPTPEGTVTGVTIATLRALRAALDAAERERDEAWRHLEDQSRKGNQLFMRYQAERDAADATGYARGVNASATVAWAHSHPAAAAILALLPEETPMCSDTAPDISRKEVERLVSNYRAMLPHTIEKLTLDLRAALDASEREADEARNILKAYLDAGVNENLEGYARGVRDAADRLAEGIVVIGPIRGADGIMRVRKACRAAILALLPATDATAEKETRDAE